MPRPEKSYSIFHPLIPQKYIEKLRSELAGRLLQSGDPGYDHSLVIDNGRIDLRPGVVAMCANAQDVITAYKFAVDHEIAFTVRGGGHSAAGYCLNQGGLVIDLTNMTGKRLDADRQVCWAQTGNRWHDIYIYLQATNTGFIPIGGGCPTVGIPGFMLGGGLSFVSRSYGLSVDNLVSIDIVTPDGELRTISADSKSKEDKDLWWACRGGGGGNFGIAVCLRTARAQAPYEDDAGGADPLPDRSGAGSLRLLQRMDRDRPRTNWRCTASWGRWRFRRIPTPPSTPSA